MPEKVLLDDIDTYITKTDAPGIEVRVSAYNVLREETEKYRTRHGHGAIEIAMSNVDHSKMKELLFKVAKHLSPELKQSE